MPKFNDQFEKLAGEAAQRVTASADLRQQLSLLPDEAQDGDGKAVRTRGAGKAMSQMRRWLADRGMRLPEEVLAEMAGLDQGRDVLTATMADAEQVMTWAQSGAVAAKGAPAIQTMSMRVNTFMQLFAIRLRAADALMPYGAPKATPDQAPVNVTNIIVPGAPQAPQQPIEQRQVMRDVTPVTRRIEPPPMPHQIEQNQTLSRSPADAARTEGRTHETDR